jgi:hypothetical protein
MEEFSWGFTSNLIITAPHNMAKQLNTYAQGGGGGSIERD